MTDVVLRIQTALGNAIGDVSKFRESIRSTSTATVDLREEWKATTAEILVQTEKQIAAEKEKVAQYRIEMGVLRELTASYAKGSDERQIATKMEIDLQRKLQASLGETAAVATKTARESSNAARDASGLGRGAASRSGVAGVGMSALAGPGFIVGAVVGGAIDMGVKAAKAEQVAQANLTNALHDVGQARKTSQAALERYVAAEEHATGFQRDDVMQTLSQLIRSTGSLAKARTEQAVMANVARARNTDLSGAMMLVLRASEGNVGSLKRLGIEIPKVTTYEDKLKAAHITGNFALSQRAKAMDLAATKTEVMRAVTQKFAGASSGYMKTFGGETATLSNDWRDLEVTIGQKAIPVLTHLMGWLEKEIATLQHSKAVHRDLHDAIVVLDDAWKATEAIVRGVDKVTGGFGDTLKLVLTYFAVGKVLGFANMLKTNLVGAYEAGAVAAKRMVASIGTSEAAVVAESEVAGAAVDAAFPFAAIAQAAAIAVVLIIEHWSTVKDWMLKFWGWMKDTGRAAWAALKDLAKEAVYVILQYATSAIQGILEVASHLPFVGDMARRALNSIQGYINKWKPDWSNVADAWANGGTVAGQAFADAANMTIRNAKIGASSKDYQSAAATVMAAIGGGGKSFLPAPKGGALQKSLVSTGATAIGNPYKWGGAPSLSSPTDCSGLMVAIFAKHGIALPRTSEAQYAQAPIKDAKPLLAGDLVFAEGIHPGHVGMYVGGGLVLQDPHTGASVDTIPLKDFGWNGESARWWAAKAKKTPKGGSSNDTGKTTGGFDKAVIQAQQAAAAGKGALKQPQLTTLQGSIEAELRDLPKHLDPVEKAARDHIRKLEESLHVGMSAGQLAKDKVELARWGKTLKDEIKKQADAAKKAAREHAQELAQAWSAGWTADINIIGRSISEAWTKVQRAYSQDTSAGLTQMQRDFATKMKAFDAATQKGLDSFVVAQTPEEKALADFQAQMAAQQAAATQNQLQSDLAAAIATGDPVQIAAAQKAINDQLQQDQLASLQAAADASRVAADAKTQQQQDAYQAERDAQKQAFQDQEDAAEQAYQNQRDDQWQYLQDMHDDQVAVFDADLKLWQDALKKKSKTWHDFLVWLQNNPVSAALDGSTIDNPIDYQQPTMPGSTGGDTGGGGGGGGGGGACFVGETLVATPRGASRIDQLELGDEVLTWDFAKHKLVPSTITAIDRHEHADARETITVTAQGQELVGTREHLVYDGYQWLPLDETAILYDPKTRSLRPINSRHDGPHRDVYNIHVDHPDHNYVANGFLVHNIKKFFAGAVHYRPTAGMVGDQGPEASFPLAGQHGQAAINQLARAIILASGGAGGPSTIIHGTFLGATPTQVGRALEDLVTPAQRRAVRYPAPL